MSSLFGTVLVYGAAAAAIKIGNRHRQEQNRSRHERERRQRENERRARQEEERHRKRAEAQQRRQIEEDKRRRREEDERRRQASEAERKIREVEKRARKEEELRVKREEDERRRQASEADRRAREAEERARLIQLQKEKAAETRALREAQKAQEELTMLKKAEETRRLREEQKEKELQKQYKLREEKLERGQIMLSQAEVMILPEQLRNELDLAEHELENLIDPSDIDSYCALHIKPLVERCRECSRKYETYLQLKDECWAAAEEAGERFTDDIPFDENAERLLRERITALQGKADERGKMEYIHQAMDEELRSMGYRVVGSRDVTTPSGVSFTEELYQIEDDGVAASVLYQSDGKIAVEIGALASSSGSHDKLDEEMAEVVEDRQQSFCSKAAKFEANMSKRGVACEINRFPPNGANAPVFCVEDYDMKHEVSLLEEHHGRRTDDEPAKRLTHE